MTTNKISAVLLLHFRDNQYTLPCLDSLVEAYKVKPFATYIISIQTKDNDIIKNHPLHPTVIETEQNDGFAWANNELMKAAFKDGYENAILLNNDTTVKPDFLAPLEAQLKDETIGIVTPKIYFYPGNEFHHDDYKENERGKVIWYMGGIFDWANVYASHVGIDEVDHGQWTKVVDTEFASGCCVGITQKTVNNVGFMNEKYFLYYEDADWSLMVRNKGFRIAIEPKSIIWHKNGGSTGGPMSALGQYYQTRNRFYFGMKYAPLRTKAHLIINTFKDLWNPNPVIRQASRDAFLFRLGIQPIQSK